MTKLVRQVNFSMGEVDSINYRRTDIRSYLAAAERLNNFEIGVTGLAQKRRGTRYQMDVSRYACEQSRILYFQDSTLQWIVIIAHDKKLHLFKNNQFLLSLNSPYALSQLRELSFTMAVDSLVLAHPSIEPQRVFLKNKTYVIEPLHVAVYPSYDFGKIDYNKNSVTYSQSSNTLTLTVHGPTLGFNNNWVGGSIIGGNIDNTSTPIGYAIIIKVSVYANRTVFTANIKAKFTQAPSGSLKGKDFSIRQPAFSDALGYPSVVSFYQDRLWLGATPTLPLGVFGSKINSLTNFDVGIGLPTDAIVYNLGETDTGKIIALNSGKQLEIYTEQAEYVAPQSAEIGLTSSTFSIRQQSSIGSSSRCRPITYQNDSYFVSSGKAIYRYAFMGLGEAYSAMNVSYPSSHLIKNPRDRALRRSPLGNQNLFIYYLNDDHTIAAYQSNLETKLNAFTPFQLAKGLKLVALQDINNVVYGLVQLEKNNQFHLVAFTDEAVYLDNYRTTTLPPSGRISDLYAYEGYAVTVSFESQDYGTYIVSHGGIAVDNPERNTGRCELGLLYEARLTTLPLYAGTTATDLYKSVYKVYVEYHHSLNFKINGQLVKYQDFEAIEQQRSLQPQTGVEIVTIGSGWQRDLHVDITQKSPFPLNIQSIGYQITGTVI